MYENELNKYLATVDRLDPVKALRPELAGMTIFETPLWGYADAGDPLFQQFHDDYDVTYGNFLPPHSWLPAAATVVSVFFPFSTAVKKSNASDMSFPSDEWLHARIEGQQIINQCSGYLLDLLKSGGFDAVAPSIDPRFSASVGTWIEGDSDPGNHDYFSNWSERHVAFAAGLGTFGLSRGLITEKGMAGRFTSVITDMKFSPTPRPYTGIYEYCSRCGACIRNCPVNAIDMNEGKDHTLCSEFVDMTHSRSENRYGCGKCQVKVPCQDAIPVSNRN